MGMNDNQDTNNLMEFRQEHWDEWEKFVKDNDDYCKHSIHKEYCDECESSKEE